MSRRKEVGFETIVVDNARAMGRPRRLRQRLPTLRGSVGCTGSPYSQTTNEELMLPSPLESTVGPGDMVLFGQGESNPPVEPQFALGSHGVATVGDGLSVQAASGPVGIVWLLGDVWNPFAPKQTAAEVLVEVVRKCSTREELDAEFEKLTGRYVVLLSAQSLWVRGDACGLLEIFYGRSERPGGIVANQPGLVALLLGSVTAEDAGSAEHGWLPGRLTGHEGVQQLEPNHWLEVSTGECVRAWPTRRRVEPSYDESVRWVAEYLRGSARAALLRHDQVAVALTAGVDSRTCWCAFSAVHPAVQTFTLRYDWLTSDDPDVAVPEQLLKSLGGLDSYHVINAGDIRAGAHAFQRKFGERAVLVNSNLLEIGRCFYPFPRQWFSPALHVAYEGMKGSSGEDVELCRILADLVRLERRYGWDRRDLFYWEQRMGHWAASSWRGDFVGKINIFNSVSLFERVLAVSPKYRRGDPGLFFADVMEELRPGATSIPFNPVGTSMQKRVVRILKDLPGSGHARALGLNARGAAKLWRNRLGQGSLIS